MHEELLEVLVEGTSLGPVFRWFQGKEITSYVGISIRMERTLTSEYEPWCCNSCTIKLLISNLQIETILFHSISYLFHIKR